MRRVRVVFAFLSLALFAAMGLLLHRALASVDAERAAQRSTLAARVFDEMERTLSAFLASQEALPERRWLDAESDGPPRVAARFELSQDGRIRLSARAPATLRPVLLAWADRRAVPLDEAVSKRRDAEASQSGAPPFAAKEQKVVKDVPPAPGGMRDSVYDALQSLNRGAESRAQRAPKLEAPGRPEAESSSAALAPVLSSEPSSADSDAAPAVGQVVPAAPEIQRGGSSRPAGAVVDPLLGDRLEDGRLLLVRTVLSGERGFRQGLVLDVPVLEAFLRTGALGGETLQGSTFLLSADASPSGEAMDRAAVVHRFAEPFDPLEATLVLPALPDAVGADTILRLSLFLFAAVGAGLFALYRMVTVALRFAEQRSNFVAAVSHELKTPLTAIRMYGEMLRDGLVSSDEKRAEYYRTITAESERLSRLIDNVLEFARSERGERPLAPSRGPLAPELATLCEALRPHAAEGGFQLVLDVASDLPPVLFDRDALAQILVNLVDNALKYARGAARREVRVEAGATPGGVALRIRDFGPGVPAAELSRVFELFHRGESERTRATRGTGLGLALVRSLASRMQARVSARNADGGGFEVTLVLGLAEGS